MELIITYAVIIVLFAGIPTVLDICLAYKSLNKTRDTLIAKALEKASSLEELKEIIKEAGKAPPGIKGLTRGSIALTVIVVLGIAVFHILTVGVVGSASQEANSQIINNVLSLLTGLLAAITGFYFGSRTAEKKAEGGELPKEPEAVREKPRK
jgi:uncharacterized membrane protein